MTCQDLEADLVDLARAALAGMEDEAAVRRHLDVCATCAARFERERRLTAGLRTLSSATTVPANEIAERRLMSAFASRGANPTSSRRVTSVTRWVALAAAACVLFFLGYRAAIEWRGAVTTPAPVMASKQVAPPSRDTQPRPAEPVASPLPAPARLVATNPPVSAPRTVRTALRDARPQETDRLAGFIPLPAADGLPGFDRGMIVRVAIPAASLPAFGLAIAPEAAQMVNADVLVGQDGQARAIRLVSLVGGSRREPQ